MNTTNHSTRLDDLAGHWTAPALEIIKASGIAPVTVDLELDAWQTLKDVLQAELRQGEPIEFRTPVSVGTVMATVLQKSALLMARKFAVWAVPINWESRIRSLVRDIRLSASELALYSGMVRQVGHRRSSQPARQTDFFPRFEVLAAGG